MRTVSESLAAFAAQLQLVHLPAAVLEKAKLHLLDTIGVALVSSTLPFARTVSAALVPGGGTGSCTVIGVADRLPAAQAALVNGTLSHGIDYDDTHLESVVHVSCSIVPTSLAVAQERECSGRDMLVALIAGLETAVRLGLAAPAAFHQHGFHPTGLCGSFASAVAAARLFRCDADQIADALGLSGSMAAGSLEFLTDGSWSKRLHAGWAAHGGIIAAELARAGFRGPRAVFDGRFGFYRNHLGETGWDLDVVTRDLGKRWHLLDIAIKPFPCCHFTHAFIDCVATLQRTHDLRADQVERIECLVAPDIVPIVCEPAATKRQPQTDYDAKFSLPYTVASQLVRGHVDVDDFTETAIGDRQILEIADRVDYHAQPERDFPRCFPGEVRVVLRDGRVLQQREPTNRGGPQRPLSSAAVHEKFFRNATRAIPAAQAERLATAIARLDGADRVDDVTRNCAMERL